MTMECNKEEAMRAKDIAENKMRVKDFTGARKVVIKAQQLYPELENISQMLTVCEVHCCAGTKINGETDWYAILQIEATADEVTIKKQYRKLALLLHPDKNKFEGAEAAFKLVGEAQRTLSDPTKRNLHDIKRRTIYRTVQVKQSAQQPNRSSAARKQPSVSNNATSSTQFNGLNQQPSQPSNTSTFWTICPFCGIRYQYYQSILNKALRCQNCMKPFVAYDLNAQAVPQAVPSATNTNTQWSRVGVPQNATRGPSAHTAGQKNHFGNAAPDVRFQGNVGVGSTSSKSMPKSEFNAEAGAATENCRDNAFQKGDNVKFEKVRPEEKAAKPPSGSSKKRGRKQVVESESSADSESSDSDVVIEEHSRPGGHNAETPGSNPRRSSRLKPNISYNENGDVDDSAPRSHKRLKKSGKTDVGASNDKASCDKVDEPSRCSENGLQGREHGTGGREENSHKASSPQHNPSAQTSEQTDKLTYPDPEFYDFEKDRDASKFKVDQIWALYDDQDGMPRFYARIKNVYTPDFKVKYTWFEYDPIGEAETQWSEENLPVSCGKFKLGQSMTSRDKPIFSHIMSMKRGTKKNSFEIYPRTGEVWALFKDWDIGWTADADNHKTFEYEIVEVLSEFREGAGVTVANLVKINGFVCLFMRASDGGRRDILPSEMLRFSHKIPSYRMTGAERDNVPPGSFELDATSLPINFAECFPTITVESTKTSSRSNENAYEKQKTGELSPNKQNGADKMDAETEASPSKQSFKDQDSSLDVSAEQDDNVSTGASPTDFQYPDPEFCDFGVGRTKDSFQCGQIWALYSDVASFPNYYGMVTEVETVGRFKVDITWLDPCTTRKEEKRWAKDLSVSCGQFKIGNEQSQYDSVRPFSHLVKAEPLDKRGHYSIYPKVGEVWALFRNWDINWTQENVEDCDYDLVEILGRGTFGVKCGPLIKVDGHRCVFMPERHATTEIPASDYLSFSHQVPAFRLTEERGGKLRGYWELDPASVPQILLIMDDN